MSESWTDFSSLLAHRRHPPLLPPLPLLRLNWPHHPFDCASGRLLLLSPELSSLSLSPLKMMLFNIVSTMFVPYFFRQLVARTQLGK